MGEGAFRFTDGGAAAKLMHNVVAMGSGLLQTTLKYLHRLMLSITLSITRDLENNPSIENRNVLISKMKKADSVISRSLSRSALPMLTLVNFFRIIATTSVPPLEAPMLNRMAEPGPAAQWRRSVPEGDRPSEACQWPEIFHPRKRHRQQHTGIDSAYAESLAQKEES